MGTAAQGASREARLERLLEVGRALLADLDLESVLARVLETAQELTDARYAALGVLDPGRSHLERFLTRGIDGEAHAAIGDLPHGRGVLGVLIRDPKPLRLENVGDHPHSYGFPQAHPPMSSFLGVPIVVHGEPFGNLYLTEHPDGAFTADDEHDLLVLADWASLAIGNARAYSHVQEPRNELEQAVERQAATMEIARALAGETELSRVLELVAKRGRALTHARSAAVMLADGTRLRVAAVAGEIDRMLVGTGFDANQTVAGRALATGRSERLVDARSRLQFALASATGASSGLFVPMVFHGRPLGVLEVFDRLVDGPEFDAGDQLLLEAFAASAAAAVATAQSVAAETRRRGVEAQEAERARWARELHDETLQALAATKMMVGAARRAAMDADRDRALDSANELVVHAVGELRRLISDLRPAQLDDLGLGAAIEALARRVGEATNVPVEVSVALDGEAGEAEARLDPPIETTVYRFVQEAVTNAVRHGQPSKVEVLVVETHEQVTATVRDDGKGFDTEIRSSGFGLLGMRERVELVRGTVTVVSGSGGTTVSATIPTRRSAAARATA